MTFHLYVDLKSSQSAPVYRNARGTNSLEGSYDGVERSVSSVQPLICQHIDDQDSTSIFTNCFMAVLPMVPRTRTCYFTFLFINGMLRWWLLILTVLS